MDVISLLTLLVASALLVITGLRKQPGIGIIGTVVVIGLTLWLRDRGMGTLGFSSPENWPVTILLSAGLGLLIQLLSVTVLEPLSEKLAGGAHNHSIVEGVRGNWKALLKWLAVVWITVAALEEGIYRGFLMGEMVRLLGTGTPALIVNVLFTSAVFGLSHGYQGRSGIISTGAVGLLLALIFVFSGFNIWLALLTHGFIDTAGLILIYTGRDRA